MKPKKERNKQLETRKTERSTPKGKIASRHKGSPPTDEEYLFTLRSVLGLNDSGCGSVMSIRAETKNGLSGATLHLFKLQAGSNDSTGEVPTRNCSRILPTNVAHSWYAIAENELNEK